MEKARLHSTDPDKFWADWHRKRREERLAYWEAKRRKHLQRAFSAGAMAQYYFDQLYKD